MLEQLEKETQELQGQNPDLARLAADLRSQLYDLGAEGKGKEQELAERQTRLRLLRERSVQERQELETVEAGLDQGVPHPDSLDELAAKREELLVSAPGDTSDIARNLWLPSTQISDHS